MTTLNNNERENAARLLRDIFDTHDKVLMEDDMLLHQLIEATQTPLSDAELEEKFPDLWNHFRFDEEAMEAYRMVVELVEAEHSGALAKPAVMPPMPSLQRSTTATIDTLVDKIEQVKSDFQNAVELLFTGFTPATVGALRGKILVEGPVAVEAPDGQFAIEFDLAESARDKKLRLLTCMFEPSNVEIENSLEGIAVELIAATTDAIEQTALIEDGEVVFDELPLFQYSLRFTVNNQVFLVTDINLTEI